MIYSPIIDFLASQSLTRLVTAADEQYDEHQTACWCPFCQREKVGDEGRGKKYNHGGSDTPHFIIYNDVFGGHYGCNDGRGAQRWMCTRTGRKGYGALELYCEIYHHTLEGDSLRRACIGLLQRLGYEEDDVKQKFPYEHPYVYDMRSEAKRAVDKFVFQRKAAFTMQELYSLGCEVTTEGGVVAYSFGHDFDAVKLKEDFRTYSLVQATLPAVMKNGNRVSEIIYGTPWNPLFITFATDKDNCGCIWRPAMKDFQQIVFSNDEEHSVRKVSKWLAGDRVFMHAVENRDSSSTAVSAAVNKYAEDVVEPLVCERKDWEECVDKDGEPNGKFKRVTVPIPIPEQKAMNIVYCYSPQDAICTYYTLRNHRLSRPDNSMIQDQCWYHVAFSIGRSNFVYMEHGEWKQSKVEFSSVHHNKLVRFAERAIVLFPNTRQLEEMGCAIARSYRDMYLALLPSEFLQPLHQRQTWIYNHHPNSVRDFVLTYQMSQKEAQEYHRSFSERFHKLISGAMTTNPMVYKEKRDRNGVVNDEEGSYQINPATIWLFMRCEGYAKAVDPMSKDKIGQYVHRDGPFVDILNPESMVAAVKDSLVNYAHQTHLGNDDMTKRMACANRCNKDVNTSTITSLPTVQLNYQFTTKDETYFFYQNGALRIRKDEPHRLVKYETLNFDIDRRKVIPHKYYQPMRPTLQMQDNPEALQRKEELRAMRAQKDDNGKPLYTQRQLNQKESILNDWLQHNQFVAEWFGKIEPDMVPALRMIRGFCNTLWEQEEELVRSGEKLPAEIQQEIDARMANMMFCIGTICWGYHGGMNNVACYLMENSVANEKEASGGSGKSSLVNIFISSCRMVKAIDLKNYNPYQSQFIFQNFIPHVHDVLHLEDAPKSFSSKVYYNLVTSGFHMEQKHEKQEELKLDESPMIAVTSNYPPSDVDDSTERRIVRVLFSNRFCGSNPMTGQVARKISDVFPGFSNLGIEHMSDSDISQMANLCAVCVRFVMNHPYPIYAPNEDAKRRQQIMLLTEAFVNWADYWFSHLQNYGVIVDLQSMFDEYRLEYAQSSDDKQNKFSMKTFREKVEKYCQIHQVTMNPEHLYQTDRQKSHKYFKLKMWVTKRYFCEPEWRTVEGVVAKKIRTQESVEYGVVFYRPTDKVPTSYDELKTMQTAYMTKPDPLPCLDDDGHPFVITEDEISLYNMGARSASRELLKRRTQPQPVTVPEINQDEMPF